MSITLKNDSEKTLIINKLENSRSNGGKVRKEKSDSQTGVEIQTVRPKEKSDSQTRMEIQTVRPKEKSDSQTGRESQTVTPEAKFRQSDRMEVTQSNRKEK
jgi:hypothetical protein